MKLKKLLQGTMFAAAAAICMMAGTITANAAAGELTATDSGITGVKFYADGTMDVTKSGGQEVMVGIATVSKAGVVKVASWDVYEEATAKVDLSKLSNVKDNYIAVKSDEKDVPAVIKISASSKVVKAALHTDDAGKVTLYAGAGAKASEATPKEITTSDSYEYRTVYGAWADLAKDTDMAKYQKQGATLYVRVKGAKEDTVSTKSTTKATYNGTEITLYDTAAKLPSKEGKVNIAGMAKGPSVAVDYAKGKVTLPAKSQWRIVAANATINDQAAKEQKDVATLLGVTDTTTAKEGTLEVRIAATTKKAASRWTPVKLSVNKAIDTTKITAKNTPDTPPTASNINKGETEAYAGKETSGVAGAVLKEDGDSSVLKITYGAKNSIVIENKGNIDYEFACSKTSTTAPDDKAVVKKVAAGKKVTIKGWTDAEFVWVRVAGNKKTTTWPGKYSCLGIIDFAKVMEGTKTS